MKIDLELESKNKPMTVIYYRYHNKGYITYTFHGATISDIITYTYEEQAYRFLLNAHVPTPSSEYIVLYKRTTS